MSALNKKVIRGLLTHILIVALPIFMAAGTLHYRQGWMLLIIYSLAVIGIIMYLIKHDRQLLERRMQVGGEKDKSQRMIQPFMFLAFGTTLVLPAVDYRFNWSVVPMGVEVIGNLLLALGLITIFFVFKQNTYASAIVEIEAKQKIIDTGLYGIVRHPMYTAGIIMLVGIPLALGSWLGLVAFIPSALVLVWRVIEEEKVLIKNLAGYTDYQQRVRYRLVPFIW
jgi:protein-S-isoprenylcysteine O-methyltransferase Ste14